MNHHQLERDIQHLEHVIARLSREDRIPLSYWRNRVDRVLSSQLVPAQANRMKRLNEVLRQLEVSMQAK